MHVSVVHVSVVHVSAVHVSVVHVSVVHVSVVHVSGLAPHCTCQAEARKAAQMARLERSLGAVGLCMIKQLEL